jgi:myo-inositol-1(or 4)-monophosphatase
MRLNDVELRVLAAWRHDENDDGTRAMPDEQDVWIGLALRLALLACRHVRSCRLGDLDGPVDFKPDRSPLTAVELHVEQIIMRELARAPTPVTFIGEETSNGDVAKRITLAVDPIDGTWSLLNRTETAATSLALARDRQTFLGVVANPATGEIAYAAEGRVPRLLQLSAFGEADRAVNLPIPPAGPEGLLVSLHPQRAAGPVANALARAWQKGELDMVRSAGGAPSLGLLEVAKGNFVYVNLWDRRESAAWDLAAGLMLVRTAGGEAVDLNGQPVRHIGHRGPFIAALDAADRARVVELTRHALTASGN